MLESPEGVLRRKFLSVVVPHLLRALNVNSALSLPDRPSLVALESVHHLRVCPKWDMTVLRPAASSDPERFRTPASLWILGKTVLRWKHWLLSNLPVIRSVQPNRP